MSETKGVVRGAVDADEWDHYSVLGTNSIAVWPDLERATDDVRVAVLRLTPEGEVPDKVVELVANAILCDHDHSEDVRAALRALTKEGE